MYNSIDNSNMIKTIEKIRAINKIQTIDFSTISIIIPAYNEEYGIEFTLRDLCNCLKLEKAEIIVIDDGSNDNTAAIVKNFPRIRLLQHPFNRGYGSAIKTGVKASNGEYIIWFDSDGQHRVEDLLLVSEALVIDKLDYCIGIRNEESYEEKNRRIGKKILKTVVFLAVGQAITDFNSGLRGFRREVLLKYLHLLPKGFGASTLTTLLMIEGSHYGKCLPIVVNKRFGSSTVKQVRDGFRTLQIILHIALLFKPLVVFGSIGLLALAIGAIYGVAKALIMGEGIPVLASLLMILGVQSFFFGFLCDQVSAMRRERF